MATAWINGDEVEYTGQTIELHGGCFYVTRRLSDGKEIVTQRSPAQDAADDLERKIAWEEEQEAFRRLRTLNGDAGYYSPNLKRWISL